MPRQHRPRLGRYQVKFYGEHPDNVNGTVKNFRRWRKSRMKMQQNSRHINRSK